MIIKMQSHVGTSRIGEEGILDILMED